MLRPWLWRLFQTAERFIAYIMIANYVLKAIILFPLCAALSILHSPSSEALRFLLAVSPHKKSYLMANGLIEALFNRP